MKNNVATTLLLLTAFSTPSHAAIHGTGFYAPQVTGRNNITNPDVGDIVLDSLDGNFYGNTNGNTMTGWVNMSGGLPSGTIIAYVGTAAPAGYLLCDGTSYLRTTYAPLATALNCSGSTCAYGAADSTHFNVPDLRGQFLRGVDGGTGKDPDAASRTGATGGNTGNNVGSLQSDAFASHTHGISGTFYQAASGVVNGSVVGGGTSTTAVGTGSLGATATGGNETRPKNVYVNYIIKQ